MQESHAMLLILASRPRDYAPPTAAAFGLWACFSMPHTFCEACASPSLGCRPTGFARIWALGAAACVSLIFVGGARSLGTRDNHNRLSGFACCGTACPARGVEFAEEAFAEEALLPLAVTGQVAGAQH